jgi:hypothetical protein
MEEYYTPEPEEFVIGAEYYVPIVSMKIKKLRKEGTVKMTIRTLEDLRDRIEEFNYDEPHFSVPEEFKMRYLSKEPRGPSGDNTLLQQNNIYFSSCREYCVDNDGWNYSV